jgi:sugar phosphate isomerase/epimerase
MDRKTFMSRTKSDESGSAMRWSVATILLAPRGGQAPPPSPAERRDLYQWAAATGFQGIEISPRWYDIFALTRDHLEELRREIAGAGLSISGINVERAIVVRSAAAAENRERIRRAIDIAAVLGAEVVDVALALDWEGVASRAVVTSAEFSEEEFAESVASIKALSRQAGRHGIAVSVELHDDGLLDDAALCRRFIEEVGEANAGANPDVGNICRDPARTGDWESALVKLAPIANCWHVKNYRDCQASPLADGDIDYRRAMQIMIKARFAGWSSIESRIGEFRETQASALAYLRRIEQEIHGPHSTVLESVGNA